MDRMNDQQAGKDSGTLPLVRLALIQPFVAELDRLQFDTDSLLTSNGIARTTACDPSVFVPIIVINRFLENAAKAVGDPYLGIHVGEKLELASWPPFVEAVSSAGTLGDLFLRFIKAAKAEASTAHHRLESGTDYSFFKEVRTCKQEMMPAQNDGFTTAYAVQLLRLGAGTDWQPEKVRVTVCDLAAVPERYQGIHVLGGDNMGIALRFPSNWLLRPIDPQAILKGLDKGVSGLQIPVDLQNALHQVLKLNLNNPRLTVDLVAGLTGVSRQTLQRKLKASGTTLSSEIRTLRKQYATELLVNTGKPVTEIANAVGFGDATSFTRAFKSWTGESPRDYRKHRKQPG